MREATGDNSPSPEFCPENESFFCVSSQIWNMFYTRALSIIVCLFIRNPLKVSSGNDLPLPSKHVFDTNICWQEIKNTRHHKTIVANGSLYTESEWTSVYVRKAHCASIVLFGAPTYRTWQIGNIWRMSRWANRILRSVNVASDYIITHGLIFHVVANVCMM